MKSAMLLSLSSLIVGALAQSTFEPADFNVTEALIANGVNVSAIPELAGLSERSLLSGCSIACNSLKLVFGSKVLRPGADYDAYTSTYWSAQSGEVNPYCVFKPEKPLEVSTMVLISRLTQCPFAVRSGGHNTTPGAASMEGGITVSMEKFNEITLSSDKKTVAIGSGNRWGPVYRTLAKHNLAVAGGRASTVGVGGLTLGGGISHQSNVVGLACDNVAFYELVTASGIILNVSETKYPDLYWALRGGGNNFGIVTTFNLETFAQGPMWGGVRVYLDTSVYPKIVDAFASLIEDATEDPKAVQMMSFAVTDGKPGAQAELEYLEPVDNNNPPAILQKYLSIEPYAADSMTNKSLADTTDRLSESLPSGRRYLFWAGTYKLDRDFVSWMVEKWQKELGPLPPQGSLTLHSLSVPTMEHMSKKGGNALGLNPADGPMFHVLVYMVWDDASRDKEFHKAAQDYLNACKAESENRGLANKYLYLNYASPYQTVMVGYGEANLQKLKFISKKYDPTAVFQLLQPGGVKLEGAPAGEVI